MLRTIYVLARSYPAYLAWIKNGERDRRRYIYVSDPDQIVGIRLSSDRFTILPQAHLHPNYKEVIAKVTKVTSKAHQ